MAREGCLPAGRASVSLGEVACEARDDDSSLPRQPAAPGSARLGSPGRMRCVLVFGLPEGTRRDVSPAAVGAVGRASGDVFIRVFAFWRVLPGYSETKRRAECLIKLVSKTVPNISTASGGGRLATDYNKFTRRCRMAAQTARR